MIYDNVPSSIQIRSITKKDDFDNLDMFYDSIYNNKDIESDCNQIVFLKIYHIKYLESIYQRLSVMILIHQIVYIKILLVDCINADFSASSVSFLQEIILISKNDFLQKFLKSERSFFEINI